MKCVSCGKDFPWIGFAYSDDHEKVRFSLSLCQNCVFAAENEGDFVEISASAMSWSSELLQDLPFKVEDIEVILVGERPSDRSKDPEEKARLFLIRHVPSGKASFCGIYGKAPVEVDTRRMLKFMTGLRPRRTT